MPCTVVKVLRPLRSVARLLVSGSSNVAVRSRRKSVGHAIWSVLQRTLNTDMYVFLGLSGLSRLFVGFGEGV